MTRSIGHDVIAKYRCAQAIREGNQSSKTSDFRR